MESRPAWLKSLDGLGAKSSVFTEDRGHLRPSLDLFDGNVAIDADTVRNAIYEIPECHDCYNFHARFSQYSPCQYRICLHVGIYTEA